MNRLKAPFSVLSCESEESFEFEVAVAPQGQTVYSFREKALLQWQGASFGPMNGSVRLGLASQDVVPRDAEKEQVSRGVAGSLNLCILVRERVGRMRIS
jgi:hypothetical protein